MGKSVPKQEDMYEAVIEVIRKRDGSATRQEIDEGVAEYMELSDEQVNQLHDDKGTRTRLSYNLAWSRTYLKAFGMLDNSKRGVWLLTPKGHECATVDKKEIVNHFRSTQRKKRVAKKRPHLTNNIQSEALEGWRDELMEAVLELSPSGFEKLCQYILRESGLIEVEVIGRSGDGGIDGKGNMQLSGLLKFQCFFQCKRYRGSVTPKEIRDFRGAMAGRSDKGLFITTGVFTKAAREEANRDGAPLIDLINGDMLLDKMQELELGLKQNLVYEVNKDWFRQFK
ncbi:restriction endonuclease [Candidatus Saccharibacteria bacterium]|nr:restriction endonuclease [Candidatus Saccharibacteria bacterium]